MGAGREAHACGAAAIALARAASAVELASRLRSVPLFAFASVDELFRIALLGRQVRYEPGG